MNEQQQNHHLRMDSNPGHLGSSMQFTLRIFALDSAVVRAQNVFVRLAAI